MYINIHTHFSTGRHIELVNRTFTDVLTDYYSFGIHPWEIDKWVTKQDEIEFFASNPACLAIGEIGIDKLKGPEIQLQIELFTYQIGISEKLKMPVILHCVRSWNELLTLKNELKPQQAWIYHGFNKASILPSVLDANVYISIGASILTNKKLQKALETIPLDRLFLETDDSTCCIEEIYAAVSDIKNIPLSRLQAQIEHNFKSVFTKWITG